MHLLRHLSWLVLSFLSLLALYGGGDAKVVDMTHVFNKDSKTWPGNQNFSKSVAYNVSFTSKLWGLGYDIKMMEHTGTHIDAPLHTIIGNKPVDKIPLTDLMGPVVVFDVREKAKQDRDYALTVEDVLDHEKEYGRIEDGSIAFLNTGGAEHYYDDNKYTGSESDPKNSSTFHFPGFSEEASDFLLDKRNVKGLGSDRLSFDVGMTHEFPVHYSVLSRQRWAIENLNRVNDIPVRGAVAILMPFLIEDGTGGPTRIMAYTDMKDLPYLQGAADAAGGAQRSSGAATSLMVMAGAMGLCFLQRCKWMEAWM